MAVVPDGSPAWTRVVALEHYGGNVNKQNYLSRGAIDPLTDVAAEEFSRMVADQAAAVRTAPFMIARVQCNDTSPAAPTILWLAMMTGVREAGYEGDAPPSGFPSWARDGDGAVTATFASAYLDEYGVSGAYTPHAAKATAATASRIASAIVSGQTVRVDVTTDAGAAATDPVFTVVVT